MFQPELLQFLTSSNLEETRIEAVPVLDLQLRAEGRRDRRQPASPFSFTPHRVRIEADHDLFEDGDVRRHLYLQDVAGSVADFPQAPTVSEFRCHIAGCQHLFNTLESYEHHYSSMHRHVCSDCRRHFPSNHLLDVHILEWHDSLFQIMAEKQNMYQCLVEGCNLKFKTSKERKDHLIKAHRYPPDFRFDKPKKTKSRPPGKVVQQSDVNMELGVDTGPGSREPGAEESMELCPSQNPDSMEAVLLEHKLKPNYSYKVPASICFGAASLRGFRGGRRKK